ALTALTDLYDLAYLTQNPSASASATEGKTPSPSASAAGAKKTPPSAAAAGSKSPSAAAPASRKSPPPTTQPPGQSVTTAAATGDTSSPNTAAPSQATKANDATKPGEASKPGSLAALAAEGEIDAIHARRTKSNPRDIAHALEIAYGARARTQMLDGKLDAALQTLSAGRQSFGKSPALRDREAHYVVIGDAYDRLRLAVKLDLPELRGYLQQIRTLEPEDATAIEQMLARTLSNRIADQRAAGRSVIVDALLQDGRDLFPAWADQLNQGQPGVLPQAGVEVATGTRG